jgi:hypothetical protein
MLSLPVMFSYQHSVSTSLVSHMFYMPRQLILLNLATQLLLHYNILCIILIIHVDKN